MTPRRHAWPLILLALPAFVAVWAGWVGLGEMTGFGEIHPLPGTPFADFTLNTSITLPIGVETYAAFALYVWLGAPADWVGTTVVRFARASAIASLLLGAAGQVAYHVMKAPEEDGAPVLVTMIVSCLPVLVLGMGAALAHLMHAQDATVATALQTARADAAQAHAEAARIAEEAAQEAAAVTARVTDLEGALAAERAAHESALEGARAELEQARAVTAQPPVRPTVKRTAGARKGSARGGAQGGDLQRRTVAKERFEASVRSGRALDNAALARLLYGVDRPDQAQLRAASASASRWKRAVENGGHSDADEERTQAAGGDR